MVMLLQSRDNGGALHKVIIYVADYAKSGRHSFIHSLLRGYTICNVHPPMVYTSTLMEETINITDAFSSNKWNALRGDLWRIQIPAPAAGESIRYNTLFMYSDVKYLRQNYFATIWVNI